MSQLQKQKKLVHHIYLLRMSQNSLLKWSNGKNILVSCCFSLKTLNTNFLVQLSCIDKLMMNHDNVLGCAIPTNAGGGSYNPIWYRTSSYHFQIIENFSSLPPLFISTTLRKIRTRLQLLVLQ